MTPQQMPESRDAIILAIDSGLRRDELFSLKWWRVDLGRGSITKHLPAKVRTFIDVVAKNLRQMDWDFSGYGSERAANLSARPKLPT